MAKQLITTITVPTPYNFAVANGFVGTEEEWLVSLKGATGDITPAALAAKTAAESARDIALTAKDQAVAAAAAVPGLQQDLEALEASLPGTYGTKVEVAAKLSKTDADPLYARNVIPDYVTKPGRFNPELSAYNFTPRSLPNLGSAFARAAAGGNNAHIMIGADSIGRGAGANIPYTANAWPSLVREAYKRVWGDPGGLGWNTFNDEGNVTADPLTVVTGFVRDGDRGIHGEARNSTAAAQTIVYGPISCTKFRIVYANRVGGGQFTYKVDNGAATTIDTANAVESIQSVTVTASAQPGTHTLTIASLGAGVTILGFEAVTSDVARVKVTRAARNGAALSNFVNALNPTSSLYLFPYLAPDLLILALETNDFQAQTSIVNYKTRSHLAINAARAVNSDVLLVATIPPNVSPGPITLTDYTRALYELADEFDLPLLDMQHRWGSYAASNPAPVSFYADNLHPSPKGHVDYARAVYALIGDKWQQRNPVQLDAAQSFTAVQRFGFPSHASEQIDVGGADVYVGNTQSPVTPYALASNTGALWLAAKSGQEIFVRSRMRMDGVLPFRPAVISTGQRTSVVSPGAGDMVFDSTLGKPIWYNGSAWVDASGAAV